MNDRRRPPRADILASLAAVLRSLGGLLLLIAAWQLVVQFVYSGSGTIPTPLQIVAQFWKDGLSLYLDNALATLEAAAWGWLWGNLLAVALAVLVTVLPQVEGSVMQLGVASYCLPVVAIGPILVILFNGMTPRVVLAALSVFLTTLVGALIGLRGVDRTMLDVVHAFGGTSGQKLVKVRFRAALPSLLAALRIAAPAAVLGAIVGEYLGAESGLGVVMINAQQALEAARTWAVCIVATLVAGCGYGATSLVAHLATPWSREMRTDIDPGARRRASGGGAGPSGALRALRFAGSAAISLGVVLFAWWAALRLFAVSTFIGKGPLQVWLYLFGPNAMAEHRAQILTDLGVSLRDAFLGLAAGSIAAVLVAIAFNIWPAVRRSFIGIALALRSVPLVAMTPLIVLIFGRDLLAIAVIGGIITFFPTLVNVTLALDRTPRESTDLLHVFGASRLDMLWKVQVPNALPSLFASLRVAAPLAVTGAMLAEWLATGKGLGYAILTAIGVSDYNGLWTRVALLTAFSALLYGGIGLVERSFLARLAGTRT